MSEPVIAQLATEWATIDELCTSLAPTDWDRPTDCPGWTVRDLVSHMIGTERMLLGDAAPPAPGAVGEHVRNPIGEANEAWVDARRGLSGDEVLAEFREVTNRRLEELNALTPEDFDRVGFTPEGEGPYRRFMEIRLFDCWEHEQDIRRAVARPGHLDGPIAAAAVQKVAAAAGYVVGKKAGAPDGSTVVFEVHGPVELTVPVAVEGRARVLEDAPADPTATIRLDTEVYNALGCGRWSGEQAMASGRVELAGDTELARRVVDNMAFTI
ncbi:maleylpyruvate isomerase family mycothiol-dependent enzyme [Actinomarinicola tropica]|uniref:maleylpyruvate isomerase family mycothiol-dependent enzyme n=1 Tax=Actinomarinicola tropica TaxID=2789776 RepID=UPI00189B64F2|nr:maleylpyruvate isomerase family mycothiol-dependent enzyme [Actinomarinicola tropica]